VDESDDAVGGSSESDIIAWSCSSDDDSLGDNDIFEQKPEDFASESGR